MGWPRVGSPHQASAIGLWNDVLLCSTVLPWRACRARWPDKGPDIASITATTLDRLRPTLVSSEHPVVWGGDWNNSMQGPNPAGTILGAEAIRRLADDIGLQVPTAGQPHASPGLCSIDHIAVPVAWEVNACGAIVAQERGTRISDHDAYVVDIQTSPR